MRTYTKEEVIKIVTDELIYAFGSLNKGSLPYTVLGVVRVAFDRKEKAETNDSELNGD